MYPNWQCHKYSQRTPPGVCGRPCLGCNRLHFRPLTRLFRLSRRHNNWNIPRTINRLPAPLFNISEASPADNYHKNGIWIERRCRKLTIRVSYDKCEDIIDPQGTSLNFYINHNVILCDRETRNCRYFYCFCRQLCIYHSDKYHQFGNAVLFALKWRFVHQGVLKHGSIILL